MPTNSYSSRLPGLRSPLGWWLLILVSSLIFSGCSPGSDVTDTPSAMTLTPVTETAYIQTPVEATQDEIPTATPPQVPAAPDQPLSRYTLSSVLDYAAHILQVKQQIIYFNHTVSALDEILLLVEPNRYPGGFTLNSLAWENGEPIAGYSLNQSELRLPLVESLQPGTSIGLKLAYTLVLPNQNDPYGYTDRQTNLGDWYPYVPPYLVDEGWLVRPDAYLGEHLAYEMADFEVSIQLKEPYSASGSELIIAASALPVFEDGIYHYKHAPARNFAWTVSDLYLEQETQSGDVLVKAYSFPYHPQADTPALEETAKAVGIFSQIFEPYPHKTLSVVEADFLDGMEFDGLIFLSHAFYDFYTGNPESNLTIIAAHEVAHQWWYGLVGNDQALEPWLDEALCTYSEAFFYEKAYPELVDWWWENRIYFHEPQGWVDSTIYEVEGFYPYRDAVYLRGALFLNEVRELLGAEIFQDFLKDYLSTFRYRQANGDDFFNLLAKYTPADLAPVVGEYFARR